MDRIPELAKLRKHLLKTGGDKLELMLPPQHRDFDVLRQRSKPKTSTVLMEIKYLRECVTGLVEIIQEVYPQKPTVAYAEGC